MTTLLSATTMAVVLLLSLPAGALLASHLLFVCWVVVSTSLDVWTTFEFPHLFFAAAAPSSSSSSRQYYQDQYQRSLLQQNDDDEDGLVGSSFSSLSDHNEPQNRDVSVLIILLVVSASCLMLVGCCCYYGSKYLRQHIAATIGVSNKPPTTRPPPETQEEAQHDDDGVELVEDPSSSSSSTTTHNHIRLEDILEEPERSTTATHQATPRGPTSGATTTSSSLSELQGEAIDIPSASSQNSLDNDDTTIQTESMCGVISYHHHTMAKFLEGATASQHDEDDEDDEDGYIETSSQVEFVGEQYEI